jgi:hypothetical protein
MAKGTQRKDFLWYLVIAAVAFPLVPLFDHLGRPELERPAYFELMLILLAIKVCRDLRGRLWFWITITAIAALHVPLLMLTAHRLVGAPLAEIFVFGILDITVIFSIVRVIERVIGGKDPSVSAVSENPKSQF